MATIAVVPNNAEKKQLNLWVSKEMNDALDSASREYKFRGRTDVAVDVLENYFPAWMQMQERLKEVKSGAVSVFRPTNTGAELGEAIGQNAVAGKLSDVKDFRPATPEQVRQAHPKPKRVPKVKKK